MQTLKFYYIILLSCLFASGCAQSMSGNAYTRSQAQKAYNVHEGEVLYVREVTIEGRPGWMGTLAGAGIGYALGGTIGGGSGKKVAEAVGAAGGAIAGSAIEKKVTTDKGLEITVKLNNGEVIAVVQAADVLFNVGDRVRVLRRPKGEARVIQ